MSLVADSIMYMYRMDALEETEPTSKRWYLYRPIDSSKGIRFESEFDAASYSLNEYLQKVALYGRKRDTAMKYGNVIRPMIEYLNAKGLHTDPLKMDEVCIRTLLDDLDVMESSKKQYIDILQTWIYGEHRNAVIKRMRLLWNDNECPNAIELSHKNFMRLWDSAVGPVDKIILTLGGRCGLRRNEIKNLKMIDITPDGLRIFGKGHAEGKLRIFPLTAGVLQEISIWIKHREEMIRKCRHDCTNGLLVVVKCGHNCNAISYQNIGDRITRLGKAIGIKVTTHSLRRHHTTYISENATLDVLISLCKSMGWSNFEMFLKYVASDKTKLKGMMESKENEYILTKT